MSPIAGGLVLTACLRQKFVGYLQHEILERLSGYSAQLTPLRVQSEQLASGRIYTSLWGGSFEIPKAVASTEAK